ncbi:MAG: hypothetical protein R3236_02315, partial [Phycisphaeraceae bacterium]|nr:hypothetical protein [Phycisphaeraceae bacterium]
SVCWVPGLGRGSRNSPIIKFFGAGQGRHPICLKRIRTLDYRAQPVKDCFLSEPDLVNWASLEAGASSENGSGGKKCEKSCKIIGRD